MRWNVSSVSLHPDLWMTENTTLTNFTFNKLSFIKLESGKNKHNLNKMPQFSHIHPVITKKFHCSKSKSPISTALLGLTTWLWCGMADNVGCLCQTEGCKTDKESDLWPGNNKQLRQPLSSWFILDDFTTQLPVQNLCHFIFHFFLQNHPMGHTKPFCGCMFVIPGISDLKNYDQCHECMCNVAVFGFGSTRTWNSPELCAYLVVSAVCWVQSQSFTVELLFLHELQSFRKMFLSCTKTLIM